MIYSMNNLLSENSFAHIDSSIMKTEPICTHNIYKMITEATVDYNKSLQQLYININEKFVVGDFLKSNTMIINAYINNLKEIKILATKQLTNFFNDNHKDIKFIKDNKSSLSKLGSNTIEIDGYIYAETSTPDVYVVNEFVDHLFDILDKNAIDVYENLRGSITSGYYDELRQAILEFKNPISSKDFNKRVYEYFRNGQNDTQKTAISAHYLVSFSTNFNKEYYIKNINSFIDELIDQFNEIIKMLNEFSKCKQIESKEQLLNIITSPSANKSDFSGMYEEEEIGDEFNQYLFLILKTKTQQVTKMMEIYGTILSAKITAVNEAITQNKILCLIALDYLINKQ